jgi:hypothetical protein
VKKKYTIIYNETVTHWFDVEAESEKEALDEFNFQVDNGEIDFSRGEVTDSSINIVEA